MLLPYPIYSMDGAPDDALLAGSQAIGSNADRAEYSSLSSRPYDY